MTTDIEELNAGDERNKLATELKNRMKERYRNALAPFKELRRQHWRLCILVVLGCIALTWQRPVDGMVATLLTMVLVMAYVFECKGPTDRVRVQVCSLAFMWIPMMLLVVSYSPFLLGYGWVYDGPSLSGLFEWLMWLSIGVSFFWCPCLFFVSAVRRRPPLGARIATYAATVLWLALLLLLVEAPLNSFLPHYSEAELRDDVAAAEPDSSKSLPIATEAALLMRDLQLDVDLTPIRMAAVGDLEREAEADRRLPDDAIYSLGVLGMLEPAMLDGFKLYRSREALLDGSLPFLLDSAEDLAIAFGPPITDSQRDRIVDAVLDGVRSASARQNSNDMCRFEDAVRAWRVLEHLGAGDRFAELREVVHAMLSRYWRPSLAGFTYSMTKSSFSDEDSLAAAWLIAAVGAPDGMDLPAFREELIRRTFTSLWIWRRKRWGTSEERLALHILGTQADLPARSPLDWLIAHRLRVAIGLVFVFLGVSFVRAARV